MTFWESLQQMVDQAKVIIDRPKNSIHPKYQDYQYPFDYGFLAGTVSGDGDGIDCWVGSFGGSAVTGVIVIVDPAKGDSEIKVLIGCSSADMQVILECHKRGSMNGLLIER